MGHPKASPDRGPGSLWYEAVFLGSMTGLTLGFSLRTEGMRHVPRSGPALLIANHQSFLDPPLVGVAARRPLYYLARKTLFRPPPFAWLLRGLHGVPIDHEGLGIDGLRVILQQLQLGRAVIVYPEGERTADGNLHPFRPGVQLLIKRAQAPIIPVGIAGAYDAWPRWRPFPIPAPLFLPAGKGTIAVSIGPRLDARQFAMMPRPQLLQKLFLELKNVVDRAERLRRK